jgi:hypothetical protein
MLRQAQHDTQIESYRIELFSEVLGGIAQCHLLIIFPTDL